VIKDAAAQMRASSTPMANVGVVNVGMERKCATQIHQSPWMKNQRLNQLKS
jgi:hypothetical protein